VRLHLEQLEDRTLPSNFFAVTTADLIADINAANAAGGTNTITLTAPSASPYILTAVDNTTDGATGLPVIAKKDTLTIIGNGDTIERSTASGTPDFRLFDVTSGASLTLENLTLQNGLAFGSGSSAEGGAIYNQGALVVSAVTVQGNIAQGTPAGTNNKGTILPSGPAAGGGIWSGGSLTLENGTLIQNNQAIGGLGFFGGQFNPGAAGGDAFGGGLYITAGQANLTAVTVSNNSAIGGGGATAGHSYGGGLYLDNATATLSSDTVDNNQATQNISQLPALHYGGGLYVASGTATLSGDTVNGNLAGAPSITGYGGGMYLVAAAKVTLCNDTVQNNTAIGSSGGGIAIYKATVYIDSITVTNTINNILGNIGGEYILHNC
jgi:hypothetical protein